MELGEQIRIICRMEEETFSNKENNFRVVQCSADYNPDLFPDDLLSFGSTTTFKAVGTFDEDNLDCKVVLTGQWEKVPEQYKTKADKYQFAVSRARLILPTEPAQIKCFIRKHCRIRSNVLDEIVKKYGKNTFRICADGTELIRDFQTEVLSAKKKLSPKKINELKNFCERVVFEEELENLTKGIDIPNSVIEAIVTEFKKDSIRIIKEEPYTMCKAIGFKYADIIALSTGTPRDSRERIEYAMREAVKQCCSRTGCMCANKSDMAKLANDLLGEIPGDTKELKVKKNEIYAEILDSHDFVRSGDWLYMKEDFVTERNLSVNTGKFAHHKAELETQIENALAEWQKNNAIMLGEKQIEAVKNLKYRISIVTGGPGSGKTTTLKAIMDVYKMIFPKDEVTLMAPTGLAARRMKESTGTDASTIHHACNLIPADTNSGFSVKDDEGYIPEGLVAIDESSMVGVHLFDFVMQAIPDSRNTRIVIIGDVDQLQPIARGDVLHDFIRCGEIPTTVLDHNYRQGKDSPITDASIKIRENRAFSPNGECLFELGNGLNFKIEQNDDLRIEADAIIEDIVAAYQEGVNSFGKEKTVILTPTHYDKGKAGGYLCKDVLNKIIQSRFNPAAMDTPTVTVHGQDFRNGDRVIHRKNTEKAINGDIGTITFVSYDEDGDPEITVKFDGDDTKVIFNKKEMENMELAYAITVHSSQGCEFPFCIIPVSLSFGPMLTKALYYTGITRAKKRLDLIGNPKALQRALNNYKRVERKSFLGVRIIHWIDKTKSSKETA